MKLIMTLAALALTAAVLAVTLVRVEYRIEAPVTLRAEERRTISVPFDAIIASAPEGSESGVKVEAGQVLCVVEAMKMENELVAHRAGTVADLAVVAGGAVTNEQVICRVLAE